MVEMVESAMFVQQKTFSRAKAAAIPTAGFVPGATRGVGEPPTPPAQEGPPRHCEFVHLSSGAQSRSA